MIESATPEVQQNIQIPSSNLPRLVIVGGGFAGIELAKKLRNLKYQVIMIDRHNYHTFQPLLYQVATAGLEPDSIAGPLRKILEDQENFYFRMATVTRVNPGQNCIETTIGNLNYDYLVIANGTKTNYFGNEGVYKNAFPLKQVPQALDLRSHILQNFERAVNTSDMDERKSLLNFVIVGGGPTGVELAGAFGELKKHVLPKDYPDLDLTQMKIYLVEGLDRLLPAMTNFASQKADRYLKKLGVTIKLKTMVKKYDGFKVEMSDDSEVISNTLIWAAGVQGNILEGLPESSIEKGRLLVNEFNQMKGSENVFVIGDLAMMKSEDNPKGHPMLAPVAMQQGRHLAKNFKRMMKKKPLKPFKYYDKGSMATVGRNKAVVNLPGNINFGGFFAWYVWLFIHLLYIIGFRRKIVVFSNWAWNYFTYDRGTRLIIRPFNKEKNLTPKD